MCHCLDALLIDNFFVSFPVNFHGKNVEQARIEFYCFVIATVSIGAFIDLHAVCYEKGLTKCESLHALMPCGPYLPTHPPDPDGNCPPRAERAPNLRLTRHEFDTRLIKYYSDSFHFGRIICVV